MKLYKILPGLYVRGHVRRIRDERDRCRWLKSMRIDVVVGAVRPYMEDVSKCVGAYLYYPIADGVLSDDHVMNLSMLALFIAEQLKNKKRVIIYCKRGRNRSCLIAALSVRIMKKISGKDALLYVRRRRPNSIANPHFESLLMSL